jgi:hypothetical protein
MFFYRLGAFEEYWREYLHVQKELVKQNLDDCPKVVEPNRKKLDGQTFGILVWYQWEQTFFHQLFAAQIFVENLPDKYSFVFEEQIIFLSHSPRKLAIKILFCRDKN